MTRIKICGVTRSEDAAHAASAGADFIGLNFWPRSKRYLPVDRAREVVAACRPAQIVGVFVDASADEIDAVVTEIAIDIVQLHGSESPEQVAAIASVTRRPVWKALAARSHDEVLRVRDFDVAAILLDTPTPDRGGSGRTFDWSIAQAAQQLQHRPLVLAGGLTSDNVASAIAAVSPWAVDVASGVERAPGIKDATKVSSFVAAAQNR